MREDKSENVSSQNGVSVLSAPKKKRILKVRNEAFCLPVLYSVCIALLTFSLTSKCCVCIMALFHLVLLLYVKELYVPCLCSIRAVMTGGILTRQTSSFKPIFT